jgi:hypothetical protein
MQTVQATERFADAAIFDEMVRPEHNLKFHERAQELMLLEELVELLTESPIGPPLDCRPGCSGPTSMIRR